MNQPTQENPTMNLSLLLKIFAVVVLGFVGAMFLGAFTVNLPNTALAWVAFAVAAWWLSQFVDA